MSRLRKIIGLELRVIPDPPPPPPPPPPPGTGSGGGGISLHSDTGSGGSSGSGGGSGDTHSGGEEWSTVYTIENGVIWQITYHNGKPVSVVKVSN